MVHHESNSREKSFPFVQKFFSFDIAKIGPFRKRCNTYFV